MCIRIYGEEYIGMALSARSLTTLIRLANQQAGFVVLKGHVEGQQIHEGLDGDDVSRFLDAIGV